MRKGEYLDTPKGKLGRYRWRLRRRVRLNLTGIEPRGKNNSDSERLAFQKQALEQLEESGHRVFRGPVALQLSLSTTGKTPSHVHTIAKNLLDLFSKPDPKLGTKRRGLLYLDDRQVHGLSVSCRHGQPRPRIFAVAMPWTNFLTDLDLAVHAQTELSDQDDAEFDCSDDPIDSLRDWLKNSNKYRQMLSEKAYSSFLDLQRSQAQQYLLGRSGISLANLGYLLGIGGFQFSEEWPSLYKNWESIIRKTPNRIVLAELPQIKGSSASYKQQVEAKIRRFQKRYSWIMAPLKIPVALEVIVKPPPSSRTRGIHDLDNIVRTFVIPKVLDVLQPPSHILWTTDLDELKDSESSTDRRAYNDWQYRQRLLPASTSIGITRYEVWKLPRRENDLSPGFVSVAVISDFKPSDDILDRIDDIIDRWKKEVCD